MSPKPAREYKKVVTYSSLCFFFTMTEHVSDNEVRDEGSDNPCNLHYVEVNLEELSR